ncbi:hypothetical protein KPL76_03365 [Subtercola sp. PAMC28395]|uniref:DUF6611 family protein n=1 Tax=Subtercola sp. PAMC28395 TaxID=2846775 RepID=UPI001C0C41A7|nr:DUF6611 family protein [Subtercola sp. PAMC28395]QWT24452.1 hypothetical protein KPL76_03365 [Subtercola sp. PAMC28395]
MTDFSRRGRRTSARSDDLGPLPAEHTGVDHPGADRFREANPRAQSHQTERRTSVDGHAADLGNLVGRGLVAVCEGPNRWGRVDVTPTGRTTWNRTRLTVYPPGTNAAERRALQLHRNWPVAGAVVALFVMLALSSWPPLAAAAVAVSVYGAGLMTAQALTRRIRPQVRRLVVVTVPIGGRIESLGDIGSFTAAIDRLHALDELRRRGAITPAEHEAGWAEIYSALPPRA